MAGVVRVKVRTPHGSNHPYVCACTLTKFNRKCQLSIARPFGMLGRLRVGAVAARPGKNLFGWEFADREDVIYKPGVWIRAVRKPGSPPLGLWNMHQ